jgi:CRISPR/Cas system-associated endonuclease Cas1
MWRKPREALPLVQSQHARIGKAGETLSRILDDEQGETRVRFIEISDVALGNVSITTPALSALLEREIPVTFHSHGGWFQAQSRRQGCGLRQ